MKELIKMFKYPMTKIFMLLLALDVVCYYAAEYFYINKTEMHTQLETQIDVNNSQTDILTDTEVNNTKEILK